MCEGEGERGGKGEGREEGGGGGRRCGVDMIEDAGDVAPYRQSDTSPVLERLWPLKK